MKIDEPLTGQPLEVVYTGFSSYRRVPAGLSLATIVVEEVEVCVVVVVAVPTSWRRLKEVAMRVSTLHALL